MKEIEKRMAVELLELSLKVMNETGHYIAIDFSNYGSFITVYVIKNGFREGGGFDEVFRISSFNKGIDRNYGAEEFEKVKEYLNELLRKREKVLHER